MTADKSFYLIARVTSLVTTLTFMGAIISCSSPHDINNIQKPYALCEDVKKSLELRDSAGVKATIQSHFGVNNKIRINQSGAYIPIKTFFVNEEGYFLDLSTQQDLELTIGGDPSYKKIEDCIYWYKIKG